MKSIYFCKAISVIVGFAAFTSALMLLIIVCNIINHCMRLSGGKIVIHNNLCLSKTSKIAEMYNSKGLLIDFRYQWRSVKIYVIAKMSLILSV